MYSILLHNLQFLEKYFYMYIFITGYQPDDNSNEDDNIGEDDNIFEGNNIICKYK